jgi:phospholipid transport system substrate-binding protein
MNVKMMCIRLAMAVLVIGAMTAAGVQLAVAEPERTPEQVIRDASDLTMQAIEGRRDELKADREKLFGIIDEVLLPRWDRQYTGQLVMGRAWRDATPPQREAFITGLYRKLLDSYGEGVLQYQADQLKILGTRGNLQEGPVMVDSEVRLEDGTTVPISYRLRINDGSWKVYDVVVEGISYVQNFRNQYQNEFRSKGIEGVLADLGVEVGDGGS